MGIPLPNPWPEKDIIKKIIRSTEKVPKNDKREWQKCKWCGAPSLEQNQFFVHGRRYCSKECKDWASNI